MANDFTVLDYTGVTQVTKAATDLTGAGGPKADAVCTNARRTAGALYRSAVTAVDKLNTPATPTGTGVTVTSGSLASATNYFFLVVARNAEGKTLASATGNATPGGSFNALNITIAQVTGPNGAVAVDYDVFLSTSAANNAVLWVANFTEAQRAAGGFVCTTAGTVAAGGAAGAGAVAVGVVGNGQAVNASPFLANTAFVYPAASAVNCTGYSLAHVYVQFTSNNSGALETLSISPALLNQVSGNYHVQQAISVPIGGVPGAGKRPDLTIPVDGTPGLHLLIETLTGNGASVTIWVELV